MTENVVTFGPPQEVEDLDNGSGDTPPRKVHTCEECGVELDYSGRGRPPTRCPEHKKRTAGTSTTPGGSRRPSNTKADREAKELADKLNSHLGKLALLVGAIDPFDGLAIMVGSKPVVEQAEGVLKTHNAWREELLRVQTGGSVAGLALALFVGIGAPILAHHGVIPAKIGRYPLGEALEQLPRLMLKMERNAEEAKDLLAETLRDMEREAQERKNAKKDTGPVGPTTAAI